MSIPYQKQQLVQQNKVVDPVDSSVGSAVDGV